MKYESGDHPRRAVLSVHSERRDLNTAAPQQHRLLPGRLGRRLAPLHFRVSAMRAPGPPRPSVFGVAAVGRAARPAQKAQQVSLRAHREPVRRVHLRRHGGDGRRSSQERGREERLSQR